jgi:predicted O-methyltransferase YrrM
MALVYEVPGWQDYKMTLNEPHRELEPLEREIQVVDEALDTLVQGGILPHRGYDQGKMMAHRQAVRERFDIPWTAISPRMQRLLYAINAIAQPEVMVAVGIFCGNTYISNAGAGLGPGACYRPRRLIGLEIRQEEADRARRNMDRLRDGDPSFPGQILGQDAVPFLQGFDETIDLLYLDADGPRGKGKSIYMDMLTAARHALRPGTIVIAHNSVNCAAAMADYLEHVRDARNFRQSANMIVDDQGIEVSLL